MVAAARLTESGRTAAVANPGEVPSAGMVGGDGPSSQVVCACRLITEEAVLAAIRAGAVSLLEVVRRSDAGTRCGACMPALWRLLVGEQERAGTQP